MGKIVLQLPSKAKVSIKKAAEFSGCGYSKLLVGDFDFDDFVFVFDQLR
jgi:hypothetical protein